MLLCIKHILGWLNIYIQIYICHKQIAINVIFLYKCYFAG